ncbi:unnamed protein product [Owenia fusiformis]|uniref:Uncharacterized protein n=1 Tax=Owenia fusiformis TaxID=6347 RepID=A0A8J1TT20_OWEFU|nr:unnamed protein product [Owenia fusiformis]
MDAEKLKVLVGVFLIFLPLISSQSKYSKEKNEPKDKYKMETPFRMNKINLVWQKARKRIAANRVTDLYADLKFQDSMELDAKRKMAEGLDPDGAYENTVRRKFFGILDRYNLRELGDDSDPVAREVNEIHKPDEDIDVKLANMDPKIRKLMKQAELAGLDDEEMSDLKTELDHHQLRVDEYNVLKNEIDIMDGLDTNSIEDLKDVDTDWKYAEKRRKKLKEDHHSVKEGYERLELMAKKMASGTSNELEFTEPKVYDLWVTALKGNFSVQELESLKKELHHFEHKLKKHEYIKNEVLLSEASLRQSGQKLDGDSPEKHENLIKKEKDYQYKVKKYHTDLRTRIDKMLRHSEL